MIRLIYKLSVIIGGLTKILINLGGLTWIVALRGEGTCDLRDRWIRSTPSNPIGEKYFPNVFSVCFSIFVLSSHILISEVLFLNFECLASIKN